MKYVLSLLTMTLFFGEIYPLTVSSEDATQIGERIWKNECGGRVEGLTHWNVGENFASLGIGHFIWFPSGSNESFQESFPALLHYLQKEQATVPEWLKESVGCPWNSREEFYADIESPRMKSLRLFLYETRSLQAAFMANRLEEALPMMIASCPTEEKEKISTTFHQLAIDSKGLYALLDYLNFKGSGALAKETYKGKGWGLLQVLQRIPSDTKQPLTEFIEAAKAVLQQRVENSPPERHEERWLKGWFNRLDTYSNYYTIIGNICKFG